MILNCDGKRMHENVTVYYGPFFYLVRSFIIIEDGLMDSPDGET